jgi:hypothetical protein
MKRIALLGLGLCLALPPAARADQANYDKHVTLVKDMIKALSDLAEALESVKDKDTAKAAAPKIDHKVCDKLEALGKSAEKLPKLEGDEPEKLKKQVKDDLTKQVDRLKKVAYQAGMNSGGEPAFMKSILRLQTASEALNKLGK